MFPVTAFNVSGLLAEYRLDGVQKVAQSELEVYYDDGNGIVYGAIELLDPLERIYTIEFPQPLPPVVDLSIKLDMLSELGVSKDVGLTVNSHG